MHETNAYWQPVVDLRNRLGARVRMSVVAPEASFVSDWTQMLLMPVDGYLECWDGPWPVRVVEWVELCAVRLKVRGLHGPLTLEGVDSLKDAPELSGLSVSPERVQWENPPAEVEAIRIRNPFFRPSKP